MQDLSNKNVIHIKEKGFEYLQFKKLLEYKDIISHGYALGLDVGFKTTTVKLEPASKERIELAISSYKKMSNAMEIDYRNIIQANQNHTKIIKNIQKKSSEFEENLSYKRKEIEDGLITNQKKFALATTNADCILLLFFDPIKKIIANIHSGWRGTLQRISVCAVRKMIEEYGSNPKDIICCICPSIRKCHFEVDKSVMEEFKKEFSDLVNFKFIDTDEEKIIQIKDFIENKKNKWNIDTVLINKILLEKEGLCIENIIDSGICSVCNSNIMHSYRIEKDKYNTETAIIELI